MSRDGGFARCPECRGRCFSEPVVNRGLRAAVKAIKIKVQSTITVKRPKGQKWWCRLLP